MWNVLVLSSFSRLFAWKHQSKGLYHPKSCSNYENPMFSCFVIIFRSFDIKRSYCSDAALALPAEAAQVGAHQGLPADGAGVHPGEQEQWWSTPPTLACTPAIGPRSYSVPQKIWIFHSCTPERGVTLITEVLSERFWKFSIEHWSFRTRSASSRRRSDRRRSAPRLAPFTHIFSLFCPRSTWFTLTYFSFSHYSALVILSRYFRAQLAQFPQLLLELCEDLSSLYPQYCFRLLLSNFLEHLSSLSVQIVPAMILTSSIKFPWSFAITLSSLAVSSTIDAPYRKSAVTHFFCSLGHFCHHFQQLLL